MWRPHFRSHHLVKFGVHRTFEIGDKTLICLETTYDHVIKESCEFVHGVPISQVITLSSLVVMRLVETEMKRFSFAT